MNDFRSLTLSPPGKRDHELILLEPGPPMMDEESAEQKALVAKGHSGAWRFETAVARRLRATQRARGVSFRSEPTERPCGTEATLRDHSGNWFSMTQH